MVKKLLKYELTYYLRILIFVFPIILMMGICVRILQIFQSDHPIYMMLFMSIIGMMLFASYICLLFPLVLAVIRFYKNMYSTEGYLTFTLPVSTNQHIFTKIFGYVIFELASILVIAISWLIAFIGLYPEVGIKVSEFLTIAVSKVNIVHIIIYIIEILIMLAVNLFTSPLIYYSCISIGQLAKKNRILLAIGVYYIYTVIIQVICTVLSVFSSIAMEFGIFDGIENFSTNHPYAFFHIIFWIVILINAGVGALLYFVNYKIMTNKLNLE